MYLFFPKPSSTTCLKITSFVFFASAKREVLEFEGLTMGIHGNDGGGVAEAGVDLEEGRQWGRWKR